MFRAARDSRPLTSLSGDQLAIGLSGLCLVHCLATTIFFASVASVGGVFLDNHLFHEIGLIIAIGFALITLVSGVLSHGYMMPFAVGSFGLGMMAGALSRPVAACADRDAGLPPAAFCCSPPVRRHRTSLIVRA